MTEPATSSLEGARVPRAHTVIERSGILTAAPSGGGYGNLRGRAAVDPARQRRSTCSPLVRPAVRAVLRLRRAPRDALAVTTRPCGCVARTGRGTPSRWLPSGTPPGLTVGSSGTDPSELGSWVGARCSAMRSVAGATVSCRTPKPPCPARSRWTRTRTGRRSCSIRRLRFRHRCGAVVRPAPARCGTPTRSWPGCW